MPNRHCKGVPVDTCVLIPATPEAEPCLGRRGVRCSCVIRMRCRDVSPYKNVTDFAGVEGVTAFNPFA